MDEKKRNVGMQIRIEYFHSLHVLLSNCSTFINPAFTIIFKSRPLCIEKQEFQLFTVTSYNIHYLQNILTMIPQEKDFRCGYDYLTSCSSSLKEETKQLPISHSCLGNNCICYSNRYPTDWKFHALTQP